MEYVIRHVAGTHSQHEIRDEDGLLIAIAPDQVRAEFVAKALAQYVAPIERKPKRRKAEAQP